MVLGIPDAYLGFLVGLLAVVLWIVTNIHLVRTGKGIKADIDSKRSETEEFVKDELQTLREGIDTKIEALEGHEGLSQEFEDFEARFTSAYTQDIQTLQTDIMTEMEKIPLRVSGIIHGAAGAEEKAFRAMVVDAEAEVEGEITVMEAVAAQDPRAMQVAIAQKIQKLGNDPDWQKEHQLGSLILEMGKPTLMNWVQTMTAQMQGVPAGMTPTLLAKSNTGKIYGT